VVRSLVDVVDVVVVVVLAFVGLTFFFNDIRVWWGLLLVLVVTE
jgi:hypothetical protein